MSGRSSGQVSRARAKAGAAPRKGGSASARPFEPTESGLVVGIGASAGGLNAFRSFLANVPLDSGMAFVLVQHLSPDHKSMLVELLAKATDLPVIEAQHGMLVEANRVYVIPPDSTLTMKGRRLELMKPAPPRERRRPIDTFFSSLAESQGENAVCIVLSGTGSDGALGLKQVKESGGMTMAQAEFDHSAMNGMPHSAAATGLVDHVLPVEDMPAKLVDYQRHLREVSGHKDEDGSRKDAAEHLSSIIGLLRVQLGHDFSKYKEKTLVRRIQRRMQVLQSDTVPNYIVKLRDDPLELELLFRDLLIGVTQFFRDPDAFDALATAIDTFVGRRSSDDEARIWVPACATGEEAYSIAILFREAMAKHGVVFRVQIFATDIDDNAVSFARSARYRKSTGVSPERLARWFFSENDEIRPIRDIRDMCVFSVHSVVKDPPFSRLDILSCRNLLIYMDSDLQDRIIRLFHYALKPNGLLFLGPSEGVSRLPKLFSAEDKKHHIFRSREADARFSNTPFTTGPRFARPFHETSGMLAADDRIERSVRRTLAKYSPVFVVIDRHENILRFSGGETGRYLEPSAGAASFHLFNNLRKPLRPAVRAALHAVFATNAAALQDDVVIRINGGRRFVSVVAEPLSGGPDDAALYVVAFLDRGARTDGEREAAADEPKTSQIGVMEHELRSARAQLQSNADDLEIAHEEAKSASEEYQSVNEELQSSNEELETSKEEMQSINEELQTVNAELNSKNDALLSANSDLKNLLDSTQIATIFLDGALRVRNFTPAITDIFHLRDTDRGRPITEVVSLLTYEDIPRDVAKVLRDLSIIEREVQLKGAITTYLLRIRPYRSVDNVIDGAVMTFVNITERRKADEQKSLLLAELDHRVRNILAIVSSVVTQTLKTSASPEAFATAMEGRIVAISRAHSVLTQTGSASGASLRDLLTTELAPYSRDGKSPSIKGVEILITPRSGLSLAMAIHELASNAAKYGALSVDSGTVEVSWTLSHKYTPVLHFVWVEIGGPSIPAPPTSRGFGSTLIERTLSHEMDAVVHRDFRPSGLRCTIDIPFTPEIGAQVFIPGEGGSP